MVTTVNSREQIETLEDVLELFDQAAESLRTLHNPRVEAYCLAPLEGSQRGWLGRFARDELEDLLQALRNEELGEVELSTE